MKLHIGPVPDTPDFCPREEGWQRLREPTYTQLMLLVLPLAVLMAVAMLYGWDLGAALPSPNQTIDLTVSVTDLLVALASLAALIVAHELIHVFTLPSLGLSGATTLGFWPAKAQPYVHHEDELSRNRYIVVGLSPLTFLSIVPLLLGWLFVWMPLWLVVLSTLNAAMASGDVLGAILLIAQTPQDTIVRNKGLETWWRHAGTEER